MMRLTWCAIYSSVTVVTLLLQDLRFAPIGYQSWKRAPMSSLARAQFGEGVLIPTLAVDAETSLSALSEALYSELERLQPSDMEIKLLSS